jgi:hypothetical protein
MENFFLGLAVGESFFGTLSLKHLSSAEILFCLYKIHTFRRASRRPHKYLLSPIYYLKNTDGSCQSWCCRRLKVICSS